MKVNMEELKNKTRNKILILAILIAVAVFLLIIILILTGDNNKSYSNYHSEGFDDSLALTGTGGLITYDYEDAEKDDFQIATEYFISIGATGVVIRIVNSECDEPDETIAALGYNEYYSCYNNGTEYRVVIKDGQPYPVPNGGD